MQESSLEFIVGSPDFPVFDYLDPFCLIKLLHVCKSARSAAVARLKDHCQNDVQTKFHVDMFRQWLRHPIAPQQEQTTHMKMEKVYLGEMSIRSVVNSSGNLAGPLRLENIQTAADEIEKRIVVLDYKRTYHGESSTVAVFNSHGEYVCVYTTDTTQFYAVASASKMVDFSTSANVDAHLPDDLIPGTSEKKWNIPSPPNVELTPDGDFIPEVATINYSLMEEFEDLLSPTEVIYVMMHALSTDTRSIFHYTRAVFDYFDSEVFDVLEVAKKRQHREEYERSRFDTITDWKRRLLAKPYNECRTSHN